MDMKSFKIIIYSRIAIFSRSYTPNRRNTSDGEEVEKGAREMRETATHPPPPEGLNTVPKYVTHRMYKQLITNWV